MVCGSELSDVHFNRRLCLVGDCQRQRKRSIDRGHHQRHSVKRRAHVRRWRAENKQRRNIYEKTQRELKAIRASCIICSTEFRKFGSAKTCSTECSQQWRLEIRREVQNRRRVRRKSVEGSHSVGEWLLVLWICDNRCAYCGATSRLTKDHVVPISKGGTDYIENILPACLSCNSRKRDKPSFTIKHYPVGETR